MSNVNFKDLCLQGKDITLIPPTEEHFESIRKILNDPLSMEFLSFLTKKEEGGWTFEGIQKRYETKVQNQNKGLNIEFFIKNTQTQEVMGTCGFNTFDLRNKNTNFGIILGQKYWRKGFCTQAHLLCFEYAFEVLNLHRIEMHTMQTNLAMRGFYERIGLEVEFVKRESYMDEDGFKNEVGYACFRLDWIGVKKKLQNILK